MSFQIPCMWAELDKTLDQFLSDYFTKGFTYLEIQEYYAFTTSKRLACPL